MNIDNVLLSLGMGRYQLMGCMLFGLVVMFSSVSPITYIFTAGDLKYRCVIPECDVSDPAKRIYEPDWLTFTIPYRDDSGLPRKCQRYAAVAVKGDRRDDGDRVRCTPDEFNRNTTQRCSGSWVFEDSENTIVKEFKLMCEENKWKLSLVGSINSLGTFFGIPMSGVIADKYGRKFAMVFTAVSSAAMYIVQSFSTSYHVFVILEFMSSILSSGMYTATFVLALESVLPKHRVWYYSILEFFYALGALIVALIASQAKDWRLLLRILNIPSLLLISYLWITDESMRWLQIQGKHDKVLNILKRIANINRKPLSGSSLNTRIQNTMNNKKDECKDKDYISTLNEVIRSSTILWRMIKCSFLWIATTLVYYGLSIGATDIAGNKFLNFSLVALVDFPSCVLTWLLMEGLSRKAALSSMFVLNGATCIAYNFTSSQIPLLKLILFMVSKLAIACAFNIVYILTAEIFPTRIRSTMLSVCSMIGRIGSTTAPQMTLLGEYFGIFVPLFVFGLTGFLSAVVTITLPESKNVELPDTVEEAKKVGTAE